MKIQPIRGTHDLFGEQIIKYRKIEKIINKYLMIYDFNEIITPIFESTNLFAKPLGEQSDVVLKEMYTFNDRNNSSLTLRPELTTPILRAAIYNSFLNRLPQKFYSIGPTFRRERPQKGRYRQFNQINFEILGSHDLMADVELMLLADSILREIVPNKRISLYINFLGNSETLSKYKSALTSFFEKYKDDLTDDSLKKIHSNPLRILDSKEKKEIAISKNAPLISNFYDKDAQKKFDILLNLLNKVSLKYLINPNLVRGLDYYCDTVFEFKSEESGSQDTLIGGGRYDGLIKLLGGPDIPGVGWAGGVERLIMLMDNQVIKEKKIHLILMNEKFKDYGFFIANKLRKNNLNVHFNYKYNLKKLLSKANEVKADYAIIIGENEFVNKLCTLKNLNTNMQKISSIEDIIEEIVR